ncbi:AAA family ATPase [Luteimonas sp. MC1895]|uniref:AAA family ATPase n=1 Tax=Luteimonas sp. MC1895 TaxID=2819513 RepID=UPI0018F0C5CA|nr:AAA family ATPase [Luteimonas sp. MC1895]MBJ6978989.1 AAA family ATPase [Luteimonas sp. MC1895]
MTFEELMTAQAVHDVQTRLPSVEVRRWVVRALAATLRVAVAGGEAENVLTLRACRSLLQRFVGIGGDDDAGDIDVGRALAACDAQSRRLDEELRALGAPDTEVLADGLAKALRFTAAERALVSLGLHANVYPELQRAIDLVGEVDDDGAAKLFALMLDLEEREVLSAFRRDNPLRRTNGFELRHTCSRPFMFIRFNPSVVAVLRGPEATVEAILGQFFRPAPPARLKLEDFDHAASDVVLLKRYLSQVFASNRLGANVLLHGAPGTGKTELVRALASALDAQLMEVPAVDGDRDPLSPMHRLTSYSACQEVLRHQPRTMMLFDEVEDVFPDDGDDAFPGRRRGSPRDRNKGWVTGVLEDNARPTFWVSNSVRQIDPAYLRRFDMVIELATPTRAGRGRLIAQLFADLPLSERVLHRLGGESALTPGHLERLAAVLRTLAPVDEVDGAALLQSLVLQTMKALDANPQAGLRDSAMPYRADCVNADVDLRSLALGLAGQPSARLCLHGPSGTGKTEWARQLAAALGRPLHVKRISELKGMYVGQTEQLIAAAFRDAEAAGAALLIDEADSLLGNRERASQQWEVSMVNEMLTCMERFEGVFMATTNRIDAMDAASARRFDFKVGFDYLAPAQVRVLFADLLQALDVQVPMQLPLSLDALKVLTPGDFVNVYRQARLLPESREPGRLRAMLEREQSGKAAHLPTRRIGFL